MARRSGAVTPAHLLTAVLEVSDHLREVAAWAHAPGHHRADPDSESHSAVVHYDMLARQAIASAGAWASRRGARAGPEDLLIVLVDQHSPSVVGALARMGPDADRLRMAALDALGLPHAYGAVALEPLQAAGESDRAGPDLQELPEDVRAELERRRARLPLGRIRRRSDWTAVELNEQRAARRLAARRNLREDQTHLVLHHHGREVERLAAAASPDIVGGMRELARERVHGGHRTASRHWQLVPRGWVVWLGNRRVGLKAFWFRWTVQRY